MFNRFSQLPEQDMAWLESWAEAVVRASKTDQWERLNAQSNGRSAKSYDGEDVHRDSESFEVGSPYRSVQERRRAMKTAVRLRYAYNTTAQLWAEEMTGSPGRRRAS